ncbi:MAG: N-glycosylase/DNA lyase [Archaeoglobaceae archaeon]|nr:N-glycosylase/DNA lyase [Archaeoglobaceae archaeon]MDW7989243.1 N-glycosylase/DNA lyase [Archaeoglobaceae archaeon]
MREKEYLSEILELIKIRFENPEFVLKKIKKRIKEFERLGKLGQVRFNFEPFLNLEIDATIETELAFCISTANSSAKAGLKFQKMLEDKDIFSMKIEDFEKLLRISGVRFYRKKSIYIIDAIKKIQNFKIPENGSMRDLLVREIKGLGYKEASHFLRNIGIKNLAILDRHILDWLGIKQRIVSKKRYVEAEEELRDFARRIGKNLAELDLLLWSIKTGMVLK